MFKMTQSEKARKGVGGWWARGVMTKSRIYCLRILNLNRKREESEVFFVGYIGGGGKYMPLNPSVSVSSFSL